MSPFKVVSDFNLTGDQPQAVDRLVEGLDKGFKYQTLLGVTGSGKTFTIANTIARVNKPTLVISHNKTLAAQLYSEFKEFLPDNAVEYFVSYYDYYQPEAYIPRTDTYIEKETDINDEIDKLRHAATRALSERRDVVIVASVSCIYGLGEPEEYRSFVLSLKKGESYQRQKLLRRLIDMQYERNDIDFTRSRFRIRGDTLEIQPAYEEMALRIEFFGDEIERILRIDPLTGEFLAHLDSVDIYPAKHFVTSHEKLLLAIESIKREMEERLKELRQQDKLLEAARLEARTNYDLEMFAEAGYCTGVENYSRHLSGRSAGSPPWTLIDYFPNDFLLIIDESHMSLPQIRGMYHGDRSRKQTLVEYGFRLPSALDNRPFNFTEFNQHINQVVYTSATPSDYEYQHSQQVVEQLVRPTGLLEPTIEIKATKGQIDDLLYQVRLRVDKRERTLITTLTKRLAEKLADYLLEMGIKTHYLHSEIDTLKRVEILRDLRLGVYDVVVGINLLREGLDLPEVSLVAILDADKEGFLRSEGTLIQTMGRAARHIDGKVIMYADSITGSMKRAIAETERRRQIQEVYNREHKITPQGIKKAIKDITERVKVITEKQTPHAEAPISKEDIVRLIYELEKQMKTASKKLEFERAALIRDRIIDLRREFDTVETIE
ncbi:MAG: excinuclease ABC subunit UvrB [Dehalococcoidales bacterium]|jgi:excinuclease ABC subunit B|nr:excinuclease ABC subunit UvrB [Dehalococcoidales bacterium]